MNSTVSSPMPKLRVWHPPAGLTTEEPAAFASTSFTSAACAVEPVRVSVNVTSCRLRIMLSKSLSRVMDSPGPAELGVAMAWIPAPSPTLLTARTWKVVFGFVGEVGHRQSSLVVEVRAGVGAVGHVGPVRGSVGPAIVVNPVLVLGDGRSPIGGRRRPAQVNLGVPAGGGQ